MTGPGVPACRRLVEQWPASRAPGGQVVPVDSFLHELRDGPLAPLFVRGSKGSVAGLLDEIGGIRRSQDGPWDRDT